METHTIFKLRLIVYLYKSKTNLTFFYFIENKISQIIRVHSYIITNYKKKTE